MTSEGQLFEAISDYSGRQSDSQIISLTKGDIVRVLKKELVWCTIEKGGQVGKVPKGKLRACLSIPSTNENITIFTSHPNPEISFLIKLYITFSCSSVILNEEKVEYNDFEIVTKFFGGAMGKTFLVRHKRSGVLYVMKRVDYLDENDKRIADQEIALMRKLTSLYTVRLVWTFVDHVDMYVVTEYCKNGDLRKVIDQLQTLPEIERLERIWQLFAQIILALEFIHSKGVIHRDIKPENIFIMEDETIRLGDFGLARELSERNYATFAGT
ncbi:MAG: putative Serine/threonine-protein kinase Nek6, partial [Streblomastix strix]